MTETILTTGSIADFRLWLSEKGRSDNTIRAYCSDVKQFFAESGLSSCQVDSLQSTVAVWMNSRKKELSPTTSRRRIASLREFADWAGHDRLLPKFKLPSLGQNFPHPLPDPERDLQAMLDLCRTDMQRALIALLGLEGMRLHEALALRAEDLNLDEMTISVLGKGDKLRTIPITERAWGYLAPRLVAAGLSNEVNLVQYSDRGARHFITELGSRARVSRPVASHDLRATFATLAYNASGGDIVLVQAWLGHSEITTTQGYIGMSVGKMRQGGSF